MNRMGFLTLKSGLASWDCWTRAWLTREQGVLELFVCEWLEALLQADEPNFRTIDALVCGAARAGFDLNPLLQRIGRSQAIAQALFDDNSETFQKDGGPSNAFWPQIGPERETFIRWLEKMAGL